MNPPRYVGQRHSNALQIAIRLWDWSEWSRQIVRGVQRYAHSEDRWKLFVATGGVEVPRVLRRGVTWDGIITGVLSDVEGYQQLLLEGRTKLVALTASIPESLEAIPAVRVDDGRIADLIGEHLIQGGFRHFAYFGGVLPGTENLRLRSLRSFAEQRGIPVETLSGRLTHTAQSMDRLRKWLRRLPKPIGIVTWNTESARGVVTALGEIGANIPEEVAVVSWDDDRMIAETLEPTITCAVIPAERLGYEAAKLLGRMINGQPAPREPILIPSVNFLNIRQSSDVSRLKDRVVFLAQQFIREHARQPIRVDDVAEALSVSRRKLERDFSRVTEMTVGEAISHAHLEQAKQLLIETDWGLERVAKHSGFGTKVTLHRNFLKAERMTPQEFRTRFGVI